jgi:hypothetical protein
MAISHARLAINVTTPVQVTPTDDEEANNCTLQVQNLGEQAVYLGGTGLTNTSYGVSIVPGGAVTIANLSPKDEVYALSASGNSYVAVLKIVR